MKNDLVDDLQLFTNPAAIGIGLSIFRDLSTTRHLPLMKATAFAWGIVVLHYQPERAL